MDPKVSFEKDDYINIPNTNQSEACSPNQNYSISNELYQNTLNDNGIPIEFASYNIATPTPAQEEQVGDTVRNCSYVGPIPIIQITKPTPEKDEDSVRKENDVNIENTNEIFHGSGSISLECLHPPFTDITANISRPGFEDEEDQNASRLVENHDCDSLEIPRRYSSTPVLESPQSRDKTAGDLSLLSLSNTSPILAVSEATPTKQRSRLAQADGSIRSASNIREGNSKHTDDLGAGDICSDVNMVTKDTSQDVSETGNLGNNGSQRSVDVNEVIVNVDKRSMSDIHMNTIYEDPNEVSDIHMKSKDSTGFLQKSNESLKATNYYKNSAFQPPNPNGINGVTDRFNENVGNVIQAPGSFFQTSSCNQDYKKCIPNESYELSDNSRLHRDLMCPRPSIPAYPSAQATCAHHFNREGIWTDPTLFRPDQPLIPVCDPSCSPCAPSVGPYGPLCAPPAQEPQCCEPEHFVYPSIYVSSAGLISVLLRNDISVEMTVDRTIRVVSHNHMMAVATDSRGTAASLYHPAVKVFQQGATTDIACPGFRAQMGEQDTILFSNGTNYFRLEGTELQPTAPVKMPDIERDQSVGMLFSSEGYGGSLVASCMQVAAQAEYSNLPRGGVIIRINGVKITQTGGGDVTVVTGAKFIRLSSNTGTTRLANRFIDLEIDKTWSARLTRGSHSFRLARGCAVVCNGKMEAGFDDKSALKVTNFVPRHPLLADPALIRRPARQTTAPTISGHGPYNQVYVPSTPKRRPGPPPGFRWRGGPV